MPGAAMIRATTPATAVLTAAATARIAASFGGRVTPAAASSSRVATMVVASMTSAPAALCTTVRRVARLGYLTCVGVLTAWPA